MKQYFISYNQCRRNTISIWWRCISTHMRDVYITWNFRKYSHNFWKKSKVVIILYYFNSCSTFNSLISADSGRGRTGDNMFTRTKQVNTKVGRKSTVSVFVQWLLRNSLKQKQTRVLFISCVAFITFVVSQKLIFCSDYCTVSQCHTDCCKTVTRIYFSICCM